MMSRFFVSVLEIFRIYYFKPDEEKKDEINVKEHGGICKIRIENDEDDSDKIHVGKLKVPVQLVFDDFMPCLIRPSNNKNGAA